MVQALHRSCVENAQVPNPAKKGVDDPEQELVQGLAFVKTRTV